MRRRCREGLSAQKDGASTGLVEVMGLRAVAATDFSIQVLRLPRKAGATSSEGGDMLQTTRKTRHVSELTTRLGWKFVRYRTHRARNEAPGE